MQSILFVDFVCPKPYNRTTLDTEALGGTEASVIRIAEALVKTGLFTVAILQHNRKDIKVEKDVVYFGPEYLPANEVNYIIALRDPNTLLWAKEKYPRSKSYLWCHDLATSELAKSQPIFKATNSDLICVSNFHKQQITDKFITYHYSGGFRIKPIYNPIDDVLEPNGDEVNKNQLIFFSSPHKGLDNAVQIFKNLRNFNPDFKLLYANPGYFADAKYNDENLVNLGCLSHQEILGYVRTSLCVFYPNTVFPETFGLVFAEANAVGTPVVAHSFGAANEVLNHPSQIVDCRTPKPVIDRVMAWYNGNRPILKAKKEFRLKEVVKSWVNLLTR